MKPNKVYTKEKVSFNLAKLKKEGTNFEVVVDADMAITYAKLGRENKELLRELLKSEEIFEDAHKGEFASEERLKAVFKTTDPLTIANKIILEGEIQLTAEYRNKLREEKKNKLVELIHKTFVDPKTKLPHPIVRINNAMEEAKFKIDEFKTADEQLMRAVKELRAVIPLSTESRKFQIYVPSTNASKIYGLIKSYGNPEKETWGNDGSLTITIEISANLATDFIEKLNEDTHGSIDIKNLD